MIGSFIENRFCLFQQVLLVSVGRAPLGAQLSCHSVFYRLRCGSTHFSQMELLIIVFAVVGVILVIATPFQDWRFGRAINGQEDTWLSSLWKKR
jgi:hypothetical protein